MSKSSAAINRGGLTDRSGSITSGATAQTVSAAKTRNYLLIQNISVEALWVNFGTTAVADQPSIKLAPDSGSGGGTLSFEGGFVPNTLVSIIGATTGSKFVCKEA
jgi:hypothetical protein